MLIQLLAGLFLVAVLWTLFRFAMGLRWAKVAREEARTEAESRGRRVIAEIPLPGDELAFFEEDDQRFHWGGTSVARSGVEGARLLLNGNVVGDASRRGVPLPPPPAAEEYEGRERWDVLLYLESGQSARVECGTLREGVSREIAARVFEAVRREVQP
ncbi:MAG TPA: hypothetical protein VMT87_11730 [Vicinamibacteria bacterium]|nr:hypothetical protein [Vicinamibacteria bacterium]